MRNKKGDRSHRTVPVSQLKDYMQRLLKLSILFGLCFVHIPAETHEKSDILNVRFFSCSNVNLTEAGTIDWVVFGYDTTFSKKNGRGINRTIRSTGQNKNIQKEKNTRLSFFWSDGLKRSHGEHSTEENSTIDGVSINIAPEERIRLAFEGSDHDTPHMASVIVRRETSFEIIAKQGGQTRLVHKGKGNGVAQVEYTGASTLYIDFIPVTKSGGRLLGLAATLSEPGRWWVRDGRYANFYKPTPQSEQLTHIKNEPRPDFLQIAQKFADCMLQSGRDEYGKIHSPLFANMLYREQLPNLPPYPLFGAEKTKGQKRTEQTNKIKKENGQSVSPFYRFNFNNLHNYPKGLSNAGPHKMTFFGCDPYEDHELYKTLFELTRITGNTAYQTEANKAINWWFENTQGPSGLYPWGEHLGWDFQYEQPTYFEGPSKYLYHAEYHEVKDFVPFLDHLITLSQNKPSPTPLERYAQGIWNTHFWNKGKAYYNRHADYTGQEDQTNELGAFPAHLAYYLRVWIASYIHSQNPEHKKQIANILNRVLDMAISRSKTYGFYPFDLRVDLQGRDPGKTAPAQSIRLAHHAVDLALQLQNELPNVTTKFRNLATLHLGDQTDETTMRNLAWAKELKSSDFIQRKKDPLAKPDPTHMLDLSDRVLSTAHASEILYHLKLYRTFNDPAYLKTAETYGHLAYTMFCDNISPLPKGFAKGIPIHTAQGKPFPDFYFQGAKLMHAFALLGEALKEQ